jgi:hypothetical protein
MQDLSVDPNRHGLDKWDPAAVDEDAEEDEDDDGEYIDRSEWLSLAYLTCFWLNVCVQARSRVQRRTWIWIGREDQVRVVAM